MISITAGIVLVSACFFGLLLVGWSELRIATRAGRNIRRIFTVGWPIRGDRGAEEVFLGIKKKSPKSVRMKTAGKRMPCGGGFKRTDPTIASCYVREFHEELKGMTVSESDIEVVGRIEVRSSDYPPFILYLLFARNCRGECSESDEFDDPAWYSTKSLPDTMPEADYVLLPRLLCGEKLVGWVAYDKDKHLINYNLRSVETIQ